MGDEVNHLTITHRRNAIISIILRYLPLVRGVLVGAIQVPDAVGRRNYRSVLIWLWDRIKKRSDRCCRVCAYCVNRVAEMNRKNKMWLRYHVVCDARSTRISADDSEQNTKKIWTARALLQRRPMTRYTVEIGILYCQWRRRPKCRNSRAIVPRDIVTGRLCRCTVVQASTTTTPSHGPSPLARYADTPRFSECAMISARRAPHTFFSFFFPFHNNTFYKY